MRPSEEHDTKADTDNAGQRGDDRTRPSRLFHLNAQTTSQLCLAAWLVESRYLQAPGAFKVEIGVTLLPTLLNGPNEVVCPRFGTSTCHSHQTKMAFDCR